MSETQANVTDQGNAVAAESQAAPLSMQALHDFRDMLQGGLDAVNRQIDALTAQQQEAADLPSFTIVIATDHGGGSPDTFDGTGTPPTINAIDSIKAVDQQTAQTIAANRYGSLDVHAVTQEQLDAANAHIGQLVTDARKAAKAAKDE